MTPAAWLLLSALLVAIVAQVVLTGYFYRRLLQLHRHFVERMTHPHPTRGPVR